MKIISILNDTRRSIKYAMKPQSIDFNPAKLTCAFDKLKTKSKNNIVMKQDIGKCHYSFFEGDKNIGYAVFAEALSKEAKTGDRPQDWYVANSQENIEGKKELKPNLYIDEIVIDDRVGLTGEYAQRKNGKKYGTMCLQKILEWAKIHGFGSRISLVPGKTHSDIAPHKFYAKIGFEMSPTDIKNVEKWEEKYSTGPIYFNRKRYEKIDDRWVSRGQEIYLTHPEILENYPLD